MPSLPAHDPLAVLVASRDQVTARRKELEALPVLTSIGWLQFAERDEKYMQDALADWEHMAANLGITSIDWVLYDDSTHTVNKAQLQALYTEARQIRTLRNAIIFEQARALKANPATTLRDVEIWAATYLNVIGQ